jgi:peptide/nickel transport system ATP-binding protein
LWAHEISYVQQDAASALNPVFSIGSQLREVLKKSAGLRGQRARMRAIELLDAVRIPDPAAALERYPHQFSGGQLQRIAIAIALACEPSLLILDEPTTGLDVTTQADVLAMLTGLIKQRGIAAIYISHDLSLVASIAAHVVVLYAGEVVESGPVRDIIDAPRHPYARALLDSLLSSTKTVRPAVLRGRVPHQVVTDACAFAARCEFKREICAAQHPRLEAMGDGPRLVRCLRTSELGDLRSERVIVEGEDARTKHQEALLTVSGLTCRYKNAAKPAVADLSLEIGPARVAAIVGESGSGKTTLGRVLAGITTPLAGRLIWQGKPMQFDGQRRSAEQRRDIQLIFQNPSSSLNPRQTIRTILDRPLRLFRQDIRGNDARRAAAEEALVEVNLDPHLLDRYPHQLSGGQKQRVAIARAFVARPKLVICDEITSSQDVSVQAAILELVRTMIKRHGSALVFISHDLAVVRALADYVYVMQEGKVVEEGLSHDIFARPTQEYTRQLLTAAATLEEGAAIGARPISRVAPAEVPPTALA